MGVNATYEFGYITHLYPYGRGPHRCAPLVQSHISMVTPQTTPHS